MQMALIRQLEVTKWHTTYNFAILNKTIFINDIADWLRYGDMYINLKKNAFSMLGFDRTA